MKICDADNFRARKTNLIDYCNYKKIDMKDEGDGNYRLPGYGGLVIKDNGFIWFGNNKRGNAIDFCMFVLKMNFRDAVHELLAFQDKTLSKSKPLARGEGARLEKKKIFIPPDKAIDNKRVFSYLTKTRGLPTKLIKYLIDKNLIYQDNRGNCVFPCYDEDGMPRGAILRGSNPYVTFKGRAQGSDADFGWLIKPNKESKIVLVTEAPIDALSIIALSNHNDKKSPLGNVYMLALGGLMLNAIKQLLNTYPSIEEIVLGVDNDERASEFLEDVKKELREKYKIIPYRPINKKDWNEELLA